MLTRKRKPGQSEETQPSHGVTVTKRHRNLEQKPNMDQDELRSLTVETSVSDETGVNLVRQVQINLVSHCVFCLRKTSTVNQSNVPPPSLVLNREDVSSKELLEDVPSASFLGSSSQLLATFNKIWTYLGKGKQGVEMNEDPLVHLLQESQANRNSRGTAFLDLPRMCVRCAENLQTVHRLFTELRAQLDGIAGIIKESKYSGKHSWRAEHFERVLTTSNLEQHVIAATLDILDKLGRKDGNEMNVNLYSEPVGDFVPKSAVAAYLPTSFQDSHSASAALYGGANCLPEIPPVTQVLPNSLTDSIESGTLMIGPTISNSSYVEVTSVDDSLGGDFIDEDDNWVGDDPDHVKSEPEHDFREEDDSSADDKDDDFADEWTPPRTRKKSKTPILRKSVKNEGGNRVCVSRKKCQRGSYRIRAQESGQMLIRKDPKTGKDMFTCGIDGCGRTYNRWITLREHQVEKHRGRLEKKYQCDQCDKCFLLLNSLTNHKHTHLPKKTKAGKLGKDSSKLENLDIAETGIGEKDNLGGVLEAPVANTVQTVAESTIILTQTSTQDNRAAALTVPEDVKLVPKPSSSSHVEVASADGSFSGNFVDEDDNWNGNDPDYIKSEPEDDLSEEQDSSDEDDNLEEWTPPRKRRNVKSRKEISAQSISAVEMKGGQRHECDQCEKSFLRANHLTTHKRFSHSGKVSKTMCQMCDLCKQEVPLNDIRTHVREHVGNEFLLPCPNPICLFTFSKPSALHLHLAVHKEKGKLCSESVSNCEEILEMVSGRKCQECGHKVGKRSVLRAHLHRVHENSTKYFSCPINGCSEQFTARQTVQFHIEAHKVASVHANDPQSTQVCDECRSKFPVEEMQSHLKEAHGVGAEEVIKCAHCPFLFSTRDHLVKHLFEHRSSDLSCDICDDQVKFSRYVDLVKHYGNVHNVGKRFPCEHCEYVGWTRSTLEQHIGQEHERHQCDLCDKSYSNLSGLQRHKELVHTGKEKGRPPMCDLCRKIVPLKDIRAHVREHVGDEYLLPCPNPVCENAYSKPYSLYKHLVMNSKRCTTSLSNLEKVLQDLKAKSQTCQECGFQAKNTVGLRHHLNREHETTTKNFSCPIENCLEKFTVKQSVQFHIATHKTRREPEPLTTQECVLCNSTFELREMENHLKETHGIVAEEVIKCAHCPFVFPTREHLIEHLYEHRSSVLSCDICGDQVKFTKHVRLREHYFNEHNIGKRFSCQDCGSVCYSPNVWKQHLRLHEKEKMSNGEIVIRVPGKQTKHKKGYKCDVSDCDAAYNSASDLKDHKIKEHGAEPYSCKICTATLLTRKRLLKHEKEHGAIKFTCEVEGCGKSFNLNCFLKSHMSTAHRGERPHVCELCGKAYAQAQGLKDHNDVVHLGLRSHVCDTCGETFTNGSTLRRHNLIHTGERPFSCDICGQRFRHKEVLKTHVEGHRKKGADFKPNGPMKQVRKRVENKGSTSM